MNDRKHCCAGAGFLRLRTIPFAAALLAVTLAGVAHVFAAGERMEHAAPRSAAYAPGASTRPGWTWRSIPGTASTVTPTARGWAGAVIPADKAAPGMTVNGALTMGEDIADLGGVLLALDAYRVSLKGAPAPVLHGFTGDQRVLLGWAQIWRAKYRPDTRKQQVTSDFHAQEPFRVDGPLRNIDAWYAAFGVNPGDRLYLPPEQRVRIW